MILTQSTLPSISQGAASFCLSPAGTSAQRSVHRQVIGQWAGLGSTASWETALLPGRLWSTSAIPWAHGRQGLTWGLLKVPRDVVWGCHLIGGPARDADNGVSWTTALCLCVLDIWAPCILVYRAPSRCTQAGLCAHCQALQVREWVRTACGNGASGPPWQFAPITPQPGSVNFTILLPDVVKYYLSLGREHQKPKLLLSVCGLH